MKGFLSPLLCLLTLTACGHRSPATVGAAPAVHAVDTTGPDGFWRGSSTRFQADGRGCPSPGLVTAQIADRQFQLRWGSRASISALIAADGTVSGQGGDATLSGKFTGTAITADGVSPSCGLHFTLHRGV